MLYCGIVTQPPCFKKKHWSIEWKNNSQSLNWHFTECFHCDLFTKHLFKKKIISHVGVRIILTSKKNSTANARQEASVLMVLKWRDSEWVLVAGLNQDGCVCGGIEREWEGGYEGWGEEERRKWGHLGGFNRVTLWGVNIRPRPLHIDWPVIARTGDGFW